MGSYVILGRGRVAHREAPSRRLRAFPYTFCGRMVLRSDRVLEGPPTVPWCKVCERVG